MLAVYGTTLFSDFSTAFAGRPHRPAHYGPPQTQHPPWLHAYKTQNAQKAGNGFMVSHSKESPQKAQTTDLALDSCTDKTLNQVQSSHHVDSHNQRS